MVRRNLITLFAAMVTSSVIAGPIQMKCPSIESIRATGLEAVTKVSLPRGIHWQGVSQSQFDTAQTWTFRVMNFKDNIKSTADQALQDLTRLLGDMKLKAGPYVVDGVVNCIYYNKNYIVQGSAITSAI